MTNQNHIDYYIFHHDDPDGHCAGAIMQQFVLKFMTIKDDTLTICAKNYGEPIDEYQDISDDNRNIVIFLLDLSFTMDTRNIIDDMIVNDKVTKIYWMDHHRSSSTLVTHYLGEVDDYPDGYVAKKMVIKFDISSCGAKIVYRWYRENDPGKYGDPNHIEYPDFIKHLDAYDRWTKKDPDADAFICGIKATDGYNAIVDDKINMLYRMNNIEDDAKTQTIVNCGKVAFRYHMSLMDEQKDQIGFWDIKKPDGSNICIGYKNAIGQSWNFCDYLENGVIDIALIGHYDPTIEMWRYSLYTQNDSPYDVSKIAECFGGGGHKGAAGFQHVTHFFSPYNAWNTGFFKTAYPNAYAAIVGCEIRDIVKTLDPSKDDAVLPRICLKGNLSSVDWKKVINNYVPECYDITDEEHKDDDDYWETYRSSHILYVVDTSNRVRNLDSVVDMAFDIGRWIEDRDHKLRVIFFTNGEPVDAMYEPFKKLCGVYAGQTRIAITEADLMFNLGELYTDFINDCN